VQPRGYVVRESWKRRAKALRRDIYALYLAARDPRVPWQAKVIVVGVVAYALSPIDLIPDFIPVVGYLDDLLLLPLGIWLAIRFIPRDVWQDCRSRAASTLAGLPRNLWAAAVVVIIWIVAAAVCASLMWRWFG